MNIVQQLLQIILLKRGPEDLEYNETAAYVACGLFVYANYLIKVVLGTFSMPLLYTVVESAALIAYFFLSMSVLNMSNRFVQFSTGYFGVLALQAAAVVVLLSTGGSVGIAFLFIIVAIWITLVALRILIKTFDKGILLPLLIWFVSILVPSTITAAVFSGFEAESEQAFSVFQQLLQPPQ